MARFKIKAGSKQPYGVFNLAVYVQVFTILTHKIF